MDGVVELPAEPDADTKRGLERNLVVSSPATRKVNGN